MTNEDREHHGRARTAWGVAELAQQQPFSSPTGGTPPTSLGIDPGTRPPFRKLGLDLGAGALLEIIRKAPS
jgi:hypothetical protein